MTVSAPEPTGSATTATTTANPPAPPAAAPPATGTPPAAPAAPAAPPAAAAEPPAADPPGADALGDAGKQALDRMKEQWHAERDRAKALEAERDAALAKLNGTEAEYAAKLEQQRITDEAIARANKVLVERAVLAEATGKLVNPQDALKFIDVGKFDVAQDGSVDATAIAGAVTSLIQTSPYLAAQGGGFTGSVDQGARNGQPKSVDEQIAEAQAKGDWATATQLQAQQLLVLRDRQPTTTT